MKADVIVVGAGLAGLVAAAELADRGRRVVLVEQESPASFGGQALWSLGGVFLVDTPEQRRLGVHDSVELAWRDWIGAAGFDRADEDLWGRRWARAYVEFAAGEARAWLRVLGMRFFPVVAWAERARNTVPRFHLVWGTGPGVVEPFARRVRHAAGRGLVRPRFRCRVEELVTTGGAVTGVRGMVLEPDAAAPGRPTSRTAVAEFELRAPAVLLTCGGIGADHDLVRASWPDRLGPAPRRLLRGVPDHVDGHLVAVVEKTGGAVVNRDRMWHYPEGIHPLSPLWTNHGVRVLPGPSTLWCDARGRRLPPPHFPGFDTLAALEVITSTGFDHSWFVLNRRILAKEIALSGSVENPDLTARSIPRFLRRLLGTPGPVRALARHGSDIVTAATVPELVARMNSRTGQQLIDAGELHRQILDRDRALSDDPQLAAVRTARRYLGDRLTRVAAPHRLLDPHAGPLIAIRLHILSRKTLGGLRTDLSGRVLRHDGQAVPGLYAAGEAAGFGGGGMHGYRSLEGTFLGGCLFTGRQAARAIAGANA
jgi:predicted oxidoreductase